MGGWLVAFHQFRKWWWNKIHIVARSRASQLKTEVKTANRLKRVRATATANHKREGRESKRKQTHLLLLYCCVSAVQLLETNSMVCKNWQHIMRVWRARGRGNGNNSIRIIWHLVGQSWFSYALHAASILVRNVRDLESGWKEERRKSEKMAELAIASKSIHIIRTRFCVAPLRPSE